MTSWGQLLDISMYMVYGIAALVALSRAWGRFLIALFLASIGFAVAGHGVMPLWRTPPFAAIIADLEAAADAWGGLDIGIGARDQIGIVLAVTAFNLLVSCVWEKSVEWEGPFAKRGDRAKGAEDDERGD